MRNGPGRLPLASPPGGTIRVAIVLLAAALPFVVKAIVVGLDLQGYAWQSSYKLFQLLPPVLWRRRQGRGWGASIWPIDEPRPAAKTGGLAVMIAAVLAGAGVAAIVLLAPWLGIQPEAVRADLDAKFVMTPLKAVVIVVYLFTINAALEELHFRAWLDRELSARWGSPLGIACSAAMFAAMHVFIFAGGKAAPTAGLALVFAALWMAGVAWSLLARRTGGIHAAWLCHGLTDATLLTWGLIWLGYL